MLNERLNCGNVVEQMCMLILVRVTVSFALRMSCNLRDLFLHEFTEEFAEREEDTDGMY